MVMGRDGGREGRFGWKWLGFWSRGWGFGSWLGLRVEGGSSLEDGSFIVGRLNC